MLKLIIGFSIDIERPFDEVHGFLDGNGNEPFLEKSNIYQGLTS